MTYGMQIFNSDGTTAFDSSSLGGVFVGIVDLPIINATTTRYVEYPQFDSTAKLKVFPVICGDHSYSVDYTLTYPRIRYQEVNATAGVNQKPIVQEPSKISTKIMVFRL